MKSGRKAPCQNDDGQCYECWRMKVDRDSYRKRESDRCRVSCINL